MATTKTYESPDKALRLLVTKENDGEVSLRFDGGTWNTNADFLAADYEVPEAKAVLRFLSDLTENRTIIAVETRGGKVQNIWVTDDPEFDADGAEAGSKITFRHWDGSAAKW